MKIKTFYINLENDKERNELMKNELNKTNLKYERFNAINGKKYDKKYDKKISKMGRLICNNKILGCGLSHIILNDYISKSNLKYALILEDDVKINTNDKNITKEIKKIIRKINKETPDWDIIKLHYFGISFLHGSTAAYIVNKKSARKISELNVIYHVDIQMNNNFKIVNYKNDIFNTTDNNIEYPFFLNYMLFGQKIGFYMLQHFIGIGGHTIKLYHILLAIIPLIIIKDYKFIRNITIVIFLFLYYVSYLSNSYINNKFHHYILLNCYLITFTFIYFIRTNMINSLSNDNKFLCDMSFYLLLFMLIIEFIHELSYF